MSSKTLSRAANSIENMLMDLQENYSLDVSLQDVGFSPQCYLRANDYGLFLLDDIYVLSTDELKELYEYDSEKLQTLARNVKKVYNNPSYYLDNADYEDEEDDESDEDIYFEDDDESECDQRNLDDVLNGWDNVEEFDADYLEEMAEWDYSRGYASKMTVNVNGFIYECDSELELNLINKLIKENYFQELRGQNLEIEYRTKRNGRTKKYKPDLIMLNQDNFIVIVEVKPLYNIPTYKNIKKYKALANYCEENGFLYCMCDDGFRTIEDLETFEIDESVLESFTEYIYENNSFDYNGFLRLKKEFNYYAKSYLKEMIAAIVVQHDLNFKKGDLAGGIKSLKIYRKSTSTIQK